jgi:hypothetical protein
MASKKCVPLAVSKYLILKSESMAGDFWCCLPAEKPGCKNVVKSVTISSVCEKFLAPKTEQCQSST